MSPLATLPADILLGIFDWVSGEEIDFALLAVSRRIRSVLLNHPVVQALGPLGIIRTASGRLYLAVVDETPQFDSNSETKPFCVTPSLSVDEVARKPWCTHKFVQRLQYALIRTMIKIHWTPLLLRDGRLQTPESLKDILDRAMAQCKTREMVFGGITIPDTLEGTAMSECEYSLRDVLIFIKDRVTGTTKVRIAVPLKKCIFRPQGQAFLEAGFR